MNSFWKGVLHSLASVAALVLPILAHQAPWLQDSVQAVLLVGLNWVISHTIRTTTGASAAQE